MTEHEKFENKIKWYIDVWATFKLNRLIIYIYIYIYINYNPETRCVGVIIK